MSLQRSGAGNNGYRPTSLDFINRPNPVEPSNVGNHGGSVIDNRQISRGSDGELVRVLLGPRSRDSAADSRAAKPSTQSVSSGSIAAVLNDDNEPTTLNTRHAEPDQPLLRLPQLPVNRGVKRPRHRVPPVLQGLHQPPPNAGLLPSINTESVPVDPGTAVDRVVQSAPEHYVFTNRPSDAASQPQSDATRPPSKNKWTDEETAVLVKGVVRFGVGKWKQILNCSDLHFNNRSTVDLKDRFRLWTRQQAKLGRPIEVADVVPGRGPVDHTTSSTKSFAASQRRRRVNWTEAEDEALLQGFRKYGASWTSIQINPVLGGRTPTDIRDRLRIRYPDEYKKTGLAAKRRKPVLRSSKTAAQPSRTLEKVDAGQTIPASRPIFSAFDEEWLADLELPEDDVGEPIVLDRSIMDWANRQLPSLETVLAGPPPDLGNMQGIDPLATLLPRPSQ
ncbi:hypothetical protein MBLNU457_4198t1 [Dothideomycetes sp. NU457]